MNANNKSERGQAIVFLTLGFIVFLGFVALAIDGGMLYANRRNTKNASDASSLSGGGAAALSISNSAAAGEPGSIYTDWDCYSPAVANALYAANNSAINRAASNKFTLGIDSAPYDGVIENNTVASVCGEYDNGSYIDRYIDVTTGISQTTEASFAQVLYPGKLTNVVNATTRVRPMMPFVFGNAVVSLNNSCPPGGLEFKGGGTAASYVTITGGGLFSNSCIQADGNVHVVIEEGEEPIESTCLGDGCYDPDGGAYIDPPPEEGGPELPAYSYSLEPPDCYPNDATFTDYPAFNGSGTISPGRYPSIRLVAGRTVTMEPGLYCIMGSGAFTILGGQLTGTGVTIYLENGNFSSAGSATVKLIACRELECENHAMSKVLIYAETGDVSLNGTSDSDYTGLVYAPEGLITLGGVNSAIGEVHVQLVAWDVSIVGNVTLDIHYDDAQQYWKFAQIELYK
jgi:hypothetical protein